MANLGDILIVVAQMTRAAIILYPDVYRGAVPNSATIQGEISPGSPFILTKTGDNLQIMSGNYADANGDVVFRDLADGVYYAHETTTLRIWRIVVAGASTTVTPWYNTWPGAGTVSGTVQVAEPPTVGEVTVVLLRENGELAGIQHTIGHEFSFSGIASGNYEVVFMGEGVFKSDVQGPVVVP